MDSSSSNNNNNNICNIINQSDIDNSKDNKDRGAGASEEEGRDSDPAQQRGSNHGDIVNSRDKGDIENSSRDCIDNNNKNSIRNNINSDSHNNICGISKRGNIRNSRDNDDCSRCYCRRS